MAFLVVMTGRNCRDLTKRAMDSVAEQTGEEFRVCVVDDASTDGTALVVETEAERHGWTYVVRNEPVGAMRNQWDAIRALEPQEGDVVLWADLDDRLAHENVLSRVRQGYDKGALMTYGSYTSVPFSSTCAPAQPYPDRIARDGSHRAFMRAHGGILHNHLRSISWEVVSQITDADCQDSDGNWWMVAPDYAIMVPALEISRERCHFIPDVLYEYQSDNVSAEWRVRPGSVNAAHREMMSRAPKRPVTLSALRAAKVEAARRHRRRRA